LPVVAKIFESFVSRWFTDSLSPTFDALQFGCLRGRSTAHDLTSILWQSSHDQGHSVRALLIDLSKAQYTVQKNLRTTCSSVSPTMVLFVYPGGNREGVLKEKPHLGDT